MAPLYFHRASTSVVPALVLALLLPGTSAPAAETPAEGAGAAKVSYFKQVVPIFKKSCPGCHHPGKLKGDLDLTTFAAFLKGGKHGVEFKPGSLKESRLF